MTYKVKTTEKFKETLKKYLADRPLKSKEETLINNFSSSNLSDLYKLFLDLKGIKLSENLFIKLNNILQETFGINPETIFSSSERIISKVNITCLEIIIKDTFLNSSEKLLDKNETYNLSVIVSKKFPTDFLNFITNSSSDIKAQKSIIEEEILSTLENYEAHTSKEAKIENSHIASLIYITFRKLFPELNIYEVGRVKSSKSTIDNINKETQKSISNIIPSDLSAGISNDDFKEQFSLENANTDFSGLTIVLVDCKDTLHFDRKDLNSAEILKLRKIKSDNLAFIHGIKNHLEDKYQDISSNELLQIKIEILARLRESTYEECTEEFNGTSFSNLLSQALNEYNNTTQSTNSIDSHLIDNQLNEITILLNELSRRIDDKYQAQILETTIPQVLNHKDFVDILKIKSHHVKTVKKPNGFCSTYYTIITQDGRKIELQAQPRMRFKESKDGSADHSKLQNKNIDISRFFEKANSTCSDEQYQTFLNLLDKTPIELRNDLYQTPDNMLTFKYLQLKKALKAAESAVKLRTFIRNEKTSIDSTDTIIEYFPIETALVNFAEFVSPSMFSVSSSHTRFNKNVARYVDQPLVSCFEEILLKTDSTTCLSQQLIDKLESIISSSKNEITYNDILNYSNLGTTNANDGR